MVDIPAQVPPAIGDGGEQCVLPCTPFERRSNTCPGNGSHKFRRQDVVPVDRISLYPKMYQDSREVSTDSASLVVDDDPMTTMAFLTKPFAIPDLVRLVGSALSPPTVRTAMT